MKLEIKSTIRVLRVGCRMVFCCLLDVAMGDDAKEFHSGLQDGIYGTTCWHINDFGYGAGCRPRSPDLIHSDRKQMAERHPASDPQPVILLITGTQY